MVVLQRKDDPLIHFNETQCKRAAIGVIAVALTLPATRPPQLGQDARAAIPKDVQQLIVVDLSRHAELARRDDF